MSNSRYSKATQMFSEFKISLSFTFVEKFISSPWLVFFSSFTFSIIFFQFFYIAYSTCKVLFCSFILSQHLWMQSYHHFDCLAFEISSLLFNSLLSLPWSRSSAWTSIIDICRLVECLCAFTSRALTIFVLRSCLSKRVK